MPYKYLALALVVAALAACGRSAPPEPDPAAEAQRIAAEAIIVDTHIDVPYRLIASPDDVSQATAGGDFDYPRARAGGLDAAFMSIYTPAELEAEGKSREEAEQLIDLVENIVNTSNGRFAIATSPAEVRKQFEAGVISLPMGMENGSPIEGDLANLAHFHQRGIRYVTLAHSLSNHLSDSSYDEQRQWNGLSEFGIEVVEEMNRLGIMVDVSHVSDEAFWQVLDVSAAPVIASHSRQYSLKRWPAARAFMEEHGELPREEAQEKFTVAWEAENGPMPYASLDDVLDHFDHVVALVGVDHVGIGSDYDGVGDSLPTGLKDVSAYPNLVEGLLRRGYSEADIRKILGENLLRVWQAVEDYAATTSTST